MESPSQNSETEPKEESFTFKKAVEKLYENPGSALGVHFENKREFLNFCSQFYRAKRVYELELLKIGFFTEDDILSLYVRKRKFSTEVLFTLGPRVERKQWDMRVVSSLSPDKEEREDGEGASDGARPFLN